MSGPRKLRRRQPAIGPVELRTLEEKAEGAANIARIASGKAFYARATHAAMAAAGALPPTPMVMNTPEGTTDEAKVPEWDRSRHVPQTLPIDESYFPPAVRRAMAVANEYFKTPTFIEWCAQLDRYVNQLQANLLSADPENPTKLVEAKARLEVASAIVTYMHQHSHLFQKASTGNTEKAS